MPDETKKTMEAWMRAEKPGIAQYLLLFIPSLIYSAAVRFRLFLYGSGVLRKRKLKCRVISVGNLTAGGSGKTPLAMHIAVILKKNGIRPVIISRGYKGSRRRISAVSDGKAVLMGPDEAGDEPYLMASRLAGVPVVIGADRYMAGLFAIEKFSPDCVVLDDGFQHMGLERDLNILLVASEAGLGNGHLLPMGILREPVSGIRRASLILLKGNGLKPVDALRIRETGLPVMAFDYRPSMLYDINEKKPLNPATLKGKKVFAFAGTANPDAFFETLKKLGANLTGSLPFPDHHKYTDSDMERIKALSKESRLAVTTEKDAVKLAALKRKNLSILALAVDVVVNDEDSLKKLILSI